MQNPFRVATRNLTVQAKLLKTDPKLAASLKAEAARLDAADLAQATATERAKLEAAQPRNLTALCLAKKAQQRRT